MRIGKHEKAILKVLHLWEEVNPGWEWHPNQGYMCKVAREDDIEQFRLGCRVPIWMLRRDIQCGKTVLSRAIKTLREKGLIIFYGADLSTLWDYTIYPKYVGLTGKGTVLVKTAGLKS